MKSTAFIALIALTAAGCSHTSERATCALTPPIAVADYTCENGKGMSVIWWEDVAEVSTEQTALCLPRLRSGSGARYGDGVHEIWDHQGVLRVTGDGGTDTACRKTAAH